LDHLKRALSALETSRSASDRATLEHTGALLAQVHTALSISPPNSRVWDKWKRQQADWMHLDRRWRVLLDAFRPST
jgi:hypothetical protein